MDEVLQRLDRIERKLTELAEARLAREWYSTADLAAKLKENNETDWAKLLTDKDQAHWGIGTKQALGLPVLNAWVLTDYSDQRTFADPHPVPAVEELERDGQLASTPTTHLAGEEIVDPV